LDLLTQLDPSFLEAYLGGATLVSVIRGDGPGALRLLLRGEEFRKNELPVMGAEFETRFWPSAWRLPMLLAYVYLFDMDDMPHAQAAFKTAEQMTGSPLYLKSLIEKLEKPGGQYVTGLHLLEFMIAGATDSAVIERLQARLQSLKVMYFLYQTRESLAKHQPIPATDPWGGKLSIDSDGKLTTTTPHQQVFGLE
jgi:hypothetical protein